MLAAVERAFVAELNLSPVKTGNPASPDLVTRSDRYSNFNGRPTIDTVDQDWAATAFNNSDQQNWESPHPTRRRPKPGWRRSWRSPRRWTSASTSCC